MSELKVMSMADERKMREAHAKAVSKMDHDVQTMINPETVFRHALKVRTPHESGEGYHLDMQELIDSVYEEMAPKINEPEGECLGCAIGHRVSDVFWEQVEEERRAAEREAEEGK